MADLVAPPVINEEESFFGSAPHRRRIIKRSFQYPHGVETWTLWGSGKSPVVVFPETKHGEVVALRQFRPAPNDFSIELPGGNPESIENSVETAERELVKESGATAERFEILAQGKGIYFDPASNVTRFVPVVATGCSVKGEPELDKTEIAERFVVDPSRFVQMIAKGEVQDAKTIATTFLALLRLGHISFHF